MPPDFPTWLFYAVAGTAVVFYLPRLWKRVTSIVVWILKTLGDAIAEAIVEALENKLAPSWAADFDDALEEALKPIKDELVTNGGTTLKDKINTTALNVHQIQQDIEPLLSEYHRRYDPPSGTPA